MNDSSSRSTAVKPRLGRGLAALLGESASKEFEGAAIPGSKEAPIEFIRPNPRNPRKSFPASDLEELAASIRERGILQPIVVRPILGMPDTYEIVAGERRWRAAQLAGIHTVPIMSLTLNDRESLEISIIENIQRTDLNALEEANGYAHLAAEYGYSHADIGRVVGKSRSHVANTLRLLALPESVRQLLAEGTISAGHARALLAVSQPVEVANQIVEDGLTVRDVEKLAGAAKPVTDSQSKANNDPHTKDLARRLSLALGTTTSILNNNRVKEIRIKYKEFEQLEYICNKLFS